ncbi:MAG: DUF2796 domain-containing protein [Propionivibrio sp.]
MPIKHGLLVAALFAVALNATAHEKHVHGEAKLEVAIEQNELALELEMPLDSAIGFEHAPKTDQQKAALSDALHHIEDGTALWRINPEAGCALKTAKVEAPEFGGDGHADLDADYAFQCAHPEALKSIETTLFKTFPKLHRIESEWVGPKGQGAQTLTPTKPALKW